MKRKILATILILALVLTNGSLSLVEGAVEIRQQSTVSAKAALTGEEKTSEVVTDSASVQPATQAATTKPDMAATRSAAVQATTQSAASAAVQAATQSASAAVQPTTQSAASAAVQTATQSAAATQSTTQSTTAQPMAAFEQYKTVNGIQVAVKAPAGVFPEGALLSVRSMEGREEKKAETAINSQLSGNIRVQELVVLDVTITDADGNEVEPDNSKGTVQVTFENVAVVAHAEDKNAVQVYHMDNNLENAEKVNSRAEDKNISFEAKAFSPYVVATTVAGTPQLVKSIQFAKNQAGTQLIDDNTELNMTGNYWILVQMNDPIVFADDAEAADLDECYMVTKGGEYPLPAIPDKLKFSQGQLSWNVNVVLSDGSTESLGTATYTADGSGTFQVSSSSKFGSGDNHEIVNVILGLNVQLNEDKIDNNYNQEIEFTNPAQTFPFKVAENKPEDAKAPVMTKECLSTVPDATGYIDWKITVTNARNPIVYENGLILSDVLEGAHEYQTGSLLKNGVAVDTAEIVSEAAAGFSVKYAETASQAETVYTYRTKVTSAAFEGAELNNGQVSSVFRNTASLKNDTVSVCDDRTANCTETKNLNILSKEYVSADPATGEVSWKLALTKPAGYSLENVKIYDAISPSDKMYIDTASQSVSVNGVDVSPAGVYTMTTGSFNKNNKNYQYCFEIGSMDDEAKVIEISYKTQFNSIDDYNEYRYTNNSEAISNDAVLEFTYPASNGDGTFSGIGPVLSKNADGIIKTIITKSFAECDKAHQTLTWKVTVNPNKISMTNAVISDLLPADQTLVEISDVKQNDTTDIDSVTAVQNGTVDKNGVTYNKYELQLTNTQISGNKITFQVTTKLTEDQIALYSSNQGKNYYNYARLESDETGANDAQASHWYDSKVFDKTTKGSYNYNTHEMTWKLSVNENKMKLTGQKIVDDLGAKGLELQAGTDKVKVNGAEIGTTVSTVQPYYVYTGGVVTVHLPDVSEAAVGTDAAKSTIEIISHVKDSCEEYQTNDGSSIRITNDAELITDQCVSGVRDTASESFTSKLLTKDGSVNYNNGVASYKIKLNQAQLDLGGKVLSDVMCEGLQLDLTTVKLYEETVNADNGFISESTETEVSGYEIDSFTNADEKTVLNVKLPVVADKAYMLVYEAMVVDVDKAAYSNTVSLEGYVSENDAENNIDRNGNQFSQGYTSGLRYAIVTKESPTGEKLSGAKFQLQLADGTVVSTKITGADGVVKFVGLKKDTEYKMVELTPPTGYVLDANHEWTFSAPEAGTANAWKRTIVNQPENQQPPTTEPTTAAPTTAAPTTAAPTTIAPTTAAPTTAAPVTTAAAVTTKAAEDNDDGDDSQNETVTARQYVTQPVVISETVMPSKDTPNISAEETDVVQEITELMNGESSDTHDADVQEMKQKVMRLLDKDAHFFDNAPNEVRNYIRDVLGVQLGSNVATGDKSKLFLWILLMLVSMGVFVGAAKYDKIKRNRK